MAKKEKKKITDINIKGAVLKSPRSVIQAITSNIQGLKFTKVIQTYVMENNILKVQLFREGRSYMQGELLWVGNKPDNSAGCVLCFQADKSTMRQIIPSNDNSAEIVLDLNKNTIKVNTVSRVKCSVCMKPIEIFDNVQQCPICEAKGHTDHLKDWIKAKGSCPTCKKPLTFDINQIPISAED